ncbi:uncharacterized protein LOC143067334 [Mytilus galloprovincialis]|uniref:uncharacterized protein LOC143067334 n=1 Tax=Mytilus galloprovincialis TaxID=29158 RepID=UPI003F7C9F9D
MAKRRTVRIDIGVFQITPCTLLSVFLFGYALHFIGFFSPFWVIEGCHEIGLFYSCSDCLTLNHTSSLRGCFIHDSLYQEVNLWFQVISLLFNTFLLVVLIVFTLWRFYVRDVVGDGTDSGNPFDYDWLHEIIAGCIFNLIYTISGLLTLIGCIILATHRVSQLSWSFGLGCAGGVYSLIMVILADIIIIQIKRGRFHLNEIVETDSDPEDDSKALAVHVQKHAQWKLSFKRDSTVFV